MKCYKVSIFKIKRALYPLLLSCWIKQIPLFEFVEIVMKNEVLFSGRVPLIIAPIFNVVRDQTQLHTSALLMLASELQEVFT